MKVVSRDDLLFVALLAHLAPRNKGLERRAVWCFSWGHPTEVRTDGKLGRWEFCPVEGGYYLVSWYRRGMADSDCLVLCAPVEGRVTTATARPLFIPKGMRSELEKLYASLFPRLARAEGVL